MRNTKLSKVFLPWLSCDAFGVPAEGLVCYGAGGDGAGGRPREGGGRGLGDLLAQVADPLLLLVLGQGQQEHVPCRRHVVVYWREKKNNTYKYETLWWHFSKQCKEITITIILIKRREKNSQFSINLKTLKVGPLYNSPKTDCFGTHLHHRVQVSTWVQMILRQGIEYNKNVRIQSKPIVHLCKGRWRPPSCPGGPCGTWRGSGGTPRPAVAWRRATAAWSTPRSWRGSGRAWGWTRGPCGAGSWPCPPEARSPSPPLSGTRPRWHTGSGEEGKKK